MKYILNENELKNVIKGIIKENFLEVNNKKAAVITAEIDEDELPEIYSGLADEIIKAVTTDPEMTKMLWNYFNGNENNRKDAARGVKAFRDKQAATALQQGADDDLSDFDDFSINEMAFGTQWRYDAKAKMKKDGPFYEKLYGGEVIQVAYDAPFYYTQFKENIIETNCDVTLHSVDTFYDNYETSGVVSLSPDRSKDYNALTSKAYGVFEAAFTLTDDKEHLLMDKVAYTLYKVLSNNVAFRCDIPLKTNTDSFKTAVLRVTNFDIDELQRVVNEKLATMPLPKF